jgi:hypothetical protein
MARARNIKPSFFENDELGQCSPLARLLFIHLWTIADREGRLEDRPLRIKATGLPYDNCDVNALLNELHGAGFIRRYSVNKLNLIWVVNFIKHQNPHPKENASLLAEYCEAVEINGKTRKKTDRNASSLLLNPPSPSLNDESVQQAAPQTKTTKETKNANNGTNITTHLGDNPICPAEWANFASANLGWGQDRIDGTFANFVDYWRGIPAARGRKADWSATWRNWCRRDAERALRSASQTSRGVPDKTAAALGAVMANRYGIHPASGSINGDEGGLSQTQGGNSVNDMF